MIKIISGKYNFIIHDYLYPEARDDYSIEKFTYNPDFGSVFVLPLIKKYVKNITEFSERLFDVDEKILLFLSNLERIEFIDATKKKIHFMEVLI